MAKWWLQKNLFETENLEENPYLDISNVKNISVLWSTEIKSHVEKIGLAQISSKTVKIHF